MAGRSSDSVALCFENLANQSVLKMRYFPVEKKIKKYVCLYVYVCVQKAHGCNSVVCALVGEGAERRRQGSWAQRGARSVRGAARCRLRLPVRLLSEVLHGRRILPEPGTLRRSRSLFHVLPGCWRFWVPRRLLVCYGRWRSWAFERSSGVIAMGIIDVLVRDLLWRVCRWNQKLVLSSLCAIEWELQCFAGLLGVLCILHLLHSIRK